MDILSFVIFIIYTILTLIVILYISPVLSALLMFIVPAGLVYFMPTETIKFLSTKQFSFDSILIQNIHVLLLIWSAIMAVIAYSEILSWYLFKKQDHKAKQEKENTRKSSYFVNLLKIGKPKKK
jgi:predicted membrane protein